jgi:hypothetical protein
VGTAVILGAFFVLGVFATALRPFGAQPWSLWRVLGLLSDAALVLLSVALSRRSGDAASVRTNGFGLLRTMAFAATVAAVIAFVLNAIQLVESARLQMAQEYGGLLMTQGGHLEYMSRPTAPQIAIGFVVGSMAPLCRLLIPLIVYRSLGAVPHVEDLGATPDSLERA